MAPEACSCWKVLSWKFTVTSGWDALNSSRALLNVMPFELSGVSKCQMLKTFCCAIAAPLIRASDATAASVSLGSDVMDDSSSSADHSSSRLSACGPLGTGSRISLRRVDEVTAAGLLEIIERPDLTGHFERVAINRIMPALDVDRARVAGEAQLRDHVDPVAVAEPRRAHEHELLLAEDAVLADHLPAHRRVLAVHVEELVCPFADLRQRIDQIDQLVARLPFEPDIVVRRLVEHALPGILVVRDVPVAGRPVAIHRAVLEGDLDAIVGGALGEVAPHLLVPRQRVGQRLVADAASEARNAGRAKMLSVVDAVLPALQRLAIQHQIYKRIAEHADGADGDVAIADRIE